MVEDHHESDCRLRNGEPPQQVDPLIRGVTNDYEDKGENHHIEGERTVRALDR